MASGPNDDEETKEMPSTPPPARKSSVAPLESGELRIFEGAGVEVFKGARILLAVEDPGRSDALAQELRALGSVVVVSGRTEHGLLRARDLDPEVVLVDKDSMSGSGFDMNEIIRNDTRLRWAAIIVVKWEDIYPNEGVAHMERVASRVAPHRKFEEMLTKSPAEKAQFEVPLERVGPARLIRALGASHASLQVVTQTANRRFVIDLADGLVAGAKLTRPNETEAIAEGIPALAEFTELTSGQARIEKKKAPSNVNILIPYADALGTASRERIAARPSMPPAPKATVALPPELFEDSEEMPLADETTTRLEVSELSAGQRFDDKTTSPGSSVNAVSDSSVTTELPLNGKETSFDDLPTRVSKAPSESERNVAASTSLLAALDEDDDDDKDSAAPAPQSVPVVPMRTPKSAPPKLATAANATEVLPVIKANAPVKTSNKSTWINALLAVGVIAALAIVWWIRQRNQEALDAEMSAMESTPAPAPYFAPRRNPEPPPAPPNSDSPTTDPQQGLTVGANGELVQSALAGIAPIATATDDDAGRPLTGEEALAESERLYDVGRHAAEDGDIRTAEQSFLQAAELVSNNPHPMEGLARLYLRTQRGPEARIWAAKLVELRHRRADYRVLLGEAAELAGDANAAQAAYRAALEMEPNNADARRHLSTDNAASASSSSSHSSHSSRSSRSSRSASASAASPAAPAPAAAESGAAQEAPPATATEAAPAPATTPAAPATEAPPATP